MHCFTYVILTFTATEWHEINSDPSTFSFSVFLTISSSLSTVVIVSGLEHKAIFNENVTETGKNECTFNVLPLFFLVPVCWSETRSETDEPAFKRNTAESSLCGGQFVWRVRDARSPPLKLRFGLLVVHLFNGSYSAKQSRKTATFPWRRGWIVASQSSVNVDDVTSDF